MSIQDFFQARPNETTFAEFDYAQLEIRVLALASNDKQLVEDINSGVDMHTYFASKIFDKPEGVITPTERRQAKAFSFELQYGASAKGIANNWGVSTALTETFIDEYYTRYSGVRKYHEEGLEEVSATLSEEGDIDPEKRLAVPRFYIPSLWRNPMGMPLTEYRVLGNLSYNGEGARPPPTKVKNYPIQGAASDIVAIMLVRLFDYLNHGYEHAWLLNTVHDSVMCEVSLDHKDRVIGEIKEVLESVPEVLKDMFDIVCPIQFPVDFSVGNTFSEVKNSA
jgi:DNA polymerase-1